MRKIFSYLWDNILFIETLFLLVFIPLYPKLPLLDVKNTWVYIRAEDFIVLFVLMSWAVLLFRKKITLKTPLTLPILIFWLIGIVATFHGILIIFPTIANVFPNVAFLSLVRHIEYMSLFFIAYHGMKDRKLLPAVIAVLTITLLGVVFYGFGQKYLGFPAYLTMNEEFAKGIPIHLSQLSRVPSTFAGHYDLAAYLVLIIPILVSLVFGFRNFFVKIMLMLVSLLGVALLSMTVSRVSFLVLFVALFIVLYFQKKKLLLFLIPLFILLVFIFISVSPTILNRFKSTVSEVNVLVDAKTGESLGHIKFVPKEYFRDKIVLQRKARDKEEIPRAIAGLSQEEYSSASAILPFKKIPEVVPLVQAINVSTGETLPQGSGYINLYLSPVTKDLSSFFYELPPSQQSPSAQALLIYGDYIVKRAGAYDLSFTTRFQGEWPRAIAAFKRNIMFGSGYGSVSLAVDNNYLRILGEIGILGFISLFAIFLSLAIYIKKIYPYIESKTDRSFILGFSAGVISLSLNAVLIDVFEASKIAFLLWILLGITLAILVFHQKKEISLYDEIKKIATSNYAIIIYLFILSIVLFLPMLSNYFVGDDFTWLRWAASCRNEGSCSPLNLILSYFTDSHGFFYRPGAKTYFYLMYQIFWLNQVVYHAVSLLLHFVISVLFFFLSKKVLKNKTLSVLAALLFLVMSGGAEVVFWISATGYLFSVFFGLSGLLLFSLWEEKKKLYLLLASLVSIFLATLFHELGIVFPLLILAYKLKEESLSEIKNLAKRKDFLILFIPVLVYLPMRFLAQSHWFNGDYSYNILKLPFNFIGNILGYMSLITFGGISLPFYEQAREILRQNMLLAGMLIPLLLVVFVVYKFVIKKLNEEDKKIVIFGFSFFVISLLPFLGLGNITSRYAYLASYGIILILVIVIKKIYEYLTSSGWKISLGVISVLVAVFALFHIIQLQQAYLDWHGAGTRSKTFFISIDSLYRNNWSEENVEFHFVNVPIRVGQAWLFPVGLNDALWFAFRNNDAKIFIHNNIKTALEQGSSPFSHIFEFNEDGSVTEVGVKGVRKGFDNEP